MASGLDWLRACMRGEASLPPVTDALGLRLTDCGQGHATWEMDVSARLHNAMGTLHGGILCDLADAAMGVAYLTLLERGEPFTTVELKINFLRPVRSGRLVAVGRVVKAGRTLALTECDVTDPEGRLVARATSTCMRLPPRQGGR